MLRDLPLEEFSATCQGADYEKATAGSSRQSVRTCSETGSTISSRRRLGEGLATALFTSVTHDRRQSTPDFNCAGFPLSAVSSTTVQVTTAQLLARCASGHAWAGIRTQRGVPSDMSTRCTSSCLSASVRPRKTQLHSRLRTRANGPQFQYRRLVMSRLSRNFFRGRPIHRILFFMGPDRCLLIVA